MKMIAGWPISTRISGVLLVASLVTAYMMRPNGDVQKNAAAYFLLGAWVLIPPIWFMYEWAGSAELSKDAQERLKHTQDLARNVWIAFVVVLSVILKVKWPHG